MPSHKDHCDECEKKLGCDWAEVHHWLDELFKLKGIKHRRYRHNLDGIEYVRARWGDQAATAARLHIVRDLMADGCWKEEMGIPKDSQSYVMMGLY